MLKSKDLEFKDFDKVLKHFEDIEFDVNKFDKELKPLFTSKLNRFDQSKLYDYLMCINCTFLYFFYFCFVQFL